MKERKTEGWKTKRDKETTKKREKKGKKGPTKKKG